MIVDFEVCGEFLEMAASFDKVQEAYREELMTTISWLKTQGAYGGGLATAASRRLRLEAEFVDTLRVSLKSETFLSSFRGAKFS